MSQGMRLDGRFDGATNILYSTSGTIFVCGSGTRKIVAVSSALAVLGDSGQLDAAPGAMVDLNSAVWVAFPNTARKFTNAAVPVQSVSVATNGATNRWIVAAGAYIVAPGPTGGIVVIDTSGNIIQKADGLMSAITCAAATAGGIVYLFDGLGKCRVISINQSTGAISTTGDVYTNINETSGALSAVIDGTTLLVVNDSHVALISLATPLYPVLTSYTRRTEGLNDVTVLSAGHRWLSSERAVSAQTNAPPYASADSSLGVGYLGTVYGKTARVGFDTSPTAYDGTTVNLVGPIDGLWAMGNNGNLLRRVSGGTWSIITNPNGISPLESMATDGTRLCAVAVDGRIISSTNGTTWTVVDNTFYGAVGAYIAYGAGLWVVTRGNGAGFSHSSDGVTWIPSTQVGTSSIYGLWYLNGLFYTSVSGGGPNPRLFSSPDGINWTVTVEPVLGYAVTGLVYKGGAFYATAGTGTATAGGIYTATTTAGPWTLLTTSPAAWGPEALAYRNNTFVASGYYTSPVPMLMTSVSTTAAVWNTPTIPTTIGVMYGLEYSDGAWFAGSTTSIIKSTDLINWTTETLPVGSFQILCLFDKNAS